MIASTICGDSRGEAVFRAYGSSRVDILRSGVAFNNGTLFNFAEGTTGGIGCSSVATESSSWGAIKTLFR